MPEAVPGIHGSMSTPNPIAPGETDDPGASRPADRLQSGSGHMCALRISHPFPRSLSSLIVLASTASGANLSSAGPPTQRRRIRYPMKNA